MKPELKNSPNTVLPEGDENIIYEITHLAYRLYPHNMTRREQSIARVREYYRRAKEVEILVIHSPGGWGNANWEGVQDWEKSIVTGVTLTVGKLGYNYAMVQYHRSGDGIARHMRDLSKELRFFSSGVNYRAEVMAEEINFLLDKLPSLRVVLVGASQGAAFNNAAMMRVDDRRRVYSVELGTFFPHVRHRRLSDNNLAIDNNGTMPDPMCQRDLWAGFKAYIKAFSRWFKYKIKGKKVKFTNCINTPGHEYKWEYPAVNRPIVEFLTAKLGVKQTS